jgi:sugar transferase (PEP-CTERM/EpsH1 system associated)
VEPLLFLCHRIPYPPNKGDKLRSYHLLRSLCRHYAVHLGAFVDDPEDWQHASALRDLCANLCLRPLAPRAARIRSLDGLRTGDALSLAYYRDAALQRWVDEAIDAAGVSRALIFSSPMATYLANKPGVRVVVDFVDVDSAKWGDYASGRKWPLSWVYRREAERLLAFERAVAARASASVFVTVAEAELFLGLAPESAGRVHAIANGVDHAYFRRDDSRPSPYAGDEEAIVFTGAMDYWPNVDAVTWFASEVLPRVVAVRPRARFWIVGMNPAPNVLALGSAHVVVTGRVSDVRPYVQHAGAVVAPLRVTRGVQNKVLEAMSLGKVVVASHGCAEGIGARDGVEIEIANTATTFADKVIGVLAGERAQHMGRAAHAFVSARFNWDRNLAAFQDLLAHPARGEGSGYAIADALHGDSGSLHASV